MVAGVMSEIDDAELPMLKWIYSTVDDMLIATGVPKWLAVSKFASVSVISVIDVSYVVPCFENNVNDCFF